MIKRLIVLSVLFMSLVRPDMAFAGTKIGIVDGELLFDQYPGAQDASKKIADAQEELKKIITESEEKFAEFEKEKKTEAEKLTKQRELQTKIDLKAAETKKLIESLSGGLEKDIVSAIKKIAVSKGIEIVVDKRAVLYGGEDLTDLVSKELKNKPIAKVEAGKKE